MGLTKTIWATPSEYLRANEPASPVMFFAPAVLQDSARRFIAGFPGLVTYAVKSNPDEAVVENLAAAGVRGFDVASLAEIRLVRRLAPDACLHYNNPVRTRAEIAQAVELGVRSFSVDAASELEKLLALVPAGTEIAVRFKLPVNGAAYNFGAKFGATVELATTLLGRVAAAGLVASLTFHPGTQCTDPAAWETYIDAAAGIAAAAGVRIARLNVGGGFPSHRRACEPPALAPIFAAIDRAMTRAFGADGRPALLCEPGRALVAESMALAARVRALRDGEHVFLNDGIYGALAELALIGTIDRVTALSPEGRRRRGPAVERIVFGPTCDSMDRLPGTLALPADLAEEDYVLFHGLGAYSTATCTRFNGFGELAVATALSLAA